MTQYSQTRRGVNERAFATGSFESNDLLDDAVMSQMVCKLCAFLSEPLVFSGRELPPLFSLLQRPRVFVKVGINGRVELQEFAEQRAHLLRVAASQLGHLPAKCHSSTPSRSAGT